MQTLGNILLVGLGGFVGSAARYSVSLAVKGLGWECKWPLVTFVVNLVGALLIGMLWAKAAQIPESRLIITLGMAGFCGGFTTFSAFSLEVVSLLRAGDMGVALVYVLASVVLCAGGVYLGMMLVK